LVISKSNSSNIQKDESPAENNKQKTGYKIEIEIDQPLKDAPDFKRYSERLTQIITNSTPQFTVGIFGGWGTGKTTMMKMIENEIKTKHSNIAKRGLEISFPVVKRV
jgi:ABC-type phosphate/phosphonate transport system ATPase subunit